MFRWPSGPQGLGLCVAALAALMFGVLHMGRGSGGVLDKDRNLVYSDKGTYGTAGFMGKADPDTQEAFVAAGQGHTFRFRNQPLSAICVWKYDRQHPNQAIEGAVFQIRYLSGNTSGTGGTVIGTYRTSANGSFTSSFTIVSYHKTLEPYSLHVFLLSCGAGLSQ